MAVKSVVVLAAGQTSVGLSSEPSASCKRRYVIILLYDFRSVGVSISLCLSAVSQTFLSAFQPSDFVLLSVGLSYVLLSFCQRFSCRDFFLSVLVVCRFFGCRTNTLISHLRLFCFLYTSSISAVSLTL